MPQELVIWVPTQQTAAGTIVELVEQTHGAEPGGRVRITAGELAAADNPERSPGEFSAIPLRTRPYVYGVKRFGARTIDAETGAATEPTEWTEISVDSEPFGARNVRAVAAAGAGGVLGFTFTPGGFE
ncbi:hypothetical protein RAS1_09300 [Phycisphaerae bacterium RAS1]|nr:hypothetical protein RAS1_09300 [Phycisphaerae bacterium RAS1]